MVDILVGPDKKLFRVHKSFLCDRIPHFDIMFNGGWKESKEQIAEFPDDDPAAFDLLIEWVYNPDPGQLRQLFSYKDLEKGQSPASWDAVSFYSLAKKLLLSDLQDLIMSALIRYHNLEDV